MLICSILIVQLVAAGKAVIVQLRPLACRLIVFEKFHETNLNHTMLGKQLDRALGHHFLQAR